MKHINNITYRIIFSVIYLFSTLPMNLLYKISGFICIVLFRLSGYREVVTVQNISRAFPNKKYNEIQSIEKEFYRNLADLFAEVVKSISISYKKQNCKLDVKGFEFVEKQVYNGRNVIACLGHCANWEILNCLTFRVNVDVYSGYKRIKEPIINKLMFDIRSRFGVHLIESKSVARQILSNKDKPSLYLLIADQCPSNIKTDYQMIFLNQKTSIFLGPEKLARATDSAVVYINLTRKQRGHFEAECYPICENTSDIQYLGITEKYIEHLEQNIQKDPSSWLWTHKRWKR